jgi:tetrahydromethanopterin S-methyltransferase subunit G
MSAQPLEARMARIEGAFDQIDKRLDSFEHRVVASFAQVDARFAQIDGRFAQLETRFDLRLGRIEQVLESRFTWLIGLMLGTWVSLMLVVLFHR